MNPYYEKQLAKASFPQVQSNPMGPKYYNQSAKELVPAQKPYQPNQYPPQPNQPPQYTYTMQPPPPQNTATNLIMTPQQNNLMPCPFCNLPTETVANKVNGNFTMMMCCLICIFTVFCFWLAFCVDNWKDTQYKCARCNNVKHVKPGSC